MFQNLIILCLVSLACKICAYTNQAADFHQLYAYSAPIPANYTVQSRLKTSVSIQRLLYSPDEAFIVYTKFNDFESNVVYFRNRSSIQDEYTVNVGDPKVQKIEIISFSKQGSYLFVATGRSVYTCKFAHNMTDSDCLTKSAFKLPSNQTTKWIDINSNNQMVLSSDTAIIVWNVSSTGTLSSWRIANVSISTQMKTKWHPQAESQLIIVGGCTSNTTNGYIKFFNVTLNDFSYSINTSCMSTFEALKDSKTLLVSSYNQLLAYSLTKNTAVSLGNVLNKVSQYIKVNMDGSLMFLQQTTTASKPNLYVYSVSMLNNSNDGLPFSLNLIYSMESNGSNFFTLSSDGNQIIFTVKSSTEILRYSLCLNNTFYSGLQCLTCSANCTTCHNDQNTCLSCSNDSLTVSNGVCVSCSSVIPGCLTCSNTTYCRSCDPLSGFASDPVDGLCQCPAFFYLSNTSCAQCDFSGTCISCIDSNTCLKCDTSQNFVEVPVDGKCVKGLGLSEILGIVAGVLVLIFVIGGFGFWYWKRRKIQKQVKFEEEPEKKEDQKKPVQIYRNLLDQDIIKSDKILPSQILNEKPNIAPQKIPYKFEQEIIEPLPDPIIQNKEPQKKSKKKKEKQYQKQHQKQILQEKPGKSQIRQPLLVNDYKRIFQASSVNKKDKEQVTVGYSDALLAEMTDEEKMRLGLFRQFE